MKKSRYTDSQILSILKQAEANMSELCRENGMSNASFYKCRVNYAELAKVGMRKYMEKDNPHRTYRITD